MSEESEQQPGEIVIVKIRRHDPELEGAHAGVWKLAYADFVTAMMAFFLLMWLVNITTKEQRDGISAYFNPVAVATSASGTDGLLAGRTTDTKGALDAPDGAGRTPHPVASPPTVSALGATKRPPQGSQEDKGAKTREEAKPLRVAPSSAETTKEAHSGAGDNIANGADIRHFEDPFAVPEDQLKGSEGIGLSEKEVPAGYARDTMAPDLSIIENDAPLADRSRLLANLEQRQTLDTVKEKLLAELTRLMTERGLAENVQLRVDKEGLRIQISDDNKFSMFPVGSSQMTPDARALIETISSIVKDIPNGIMITGHTDARAYRGSQGYTNWELSSDRANAARRALVAGGLNPERIQRVEGHGDRVPLIKEDPMDPRNRRISILVRAEGG